MSDVASYLLEDVVVMTVSVSCTRSVYSYRSVVLYPLEQEFHNDSFSSNSCAQPFRGKHYDKLTNTRIALTSRFELYVSAAYVSVRSRYYH